MAIDRAEKSPLPPFAKWGAGGFTPSPLQEQILDALESNTSAILPDDLLRRVSATQHASRINLALQELKTAKLVYLTGNGWKRTTQPRQETAMTPETATPETTAPETTAPSGYMRNAQGHLVPIDQVREQDKLRDEAVIRLVLRGQKINRALAEYKRQALAEIADLIQIAADRYDAKIGGRKGNVSLSSYDGRYKIQRHIADRIQFGEELEAAKALINNCIDRWSEGANDNIRALVDRAFRTDTKGQIKTAAVLELLRLEIDDDEWFRAMDAIRDSIQTIGSAVYVRLYERVGESDQYRPIPLDLAAV